MKSLGSLALLCLLATTTLAKSQEPGLVADKQVIFRNQPETHVESARLVQLGENEAPLWMTEYDILQLIRQGKKFMDVTDSRDYTTKTMTVTRASKIPAEPGHKDQVQQFIDDLNAENMKQSLTKFTSFHNRYYKSPWGAKSCRWLLSKVQEIAAPAGDRVSVRKFEHRWNQFSIIARFEGSNPDLADELVIIGAHQDSVNMWLPDFGRSPGADDDGSGTVTILEAFRSLVDNGFAPERPVEFHWYSAEEGGLLGSQAIAQNYTDSNKEIVGMIQNDMTGYVGGHEPTMGVITDYVDQKLTDFIKSLIDNYCSLPYVETKCGYACSDHASWRKHGFPSGFVIESSFDDSSPHIHTSGDTLDKLSIDHMKEFAKLSIGFAVELSHAISE